MNFWVMQGNQKGPTATQRLLLQELQGRKVEEGKKAGEKGSTHSYFVAGGVIHFHGFGVCPAKRI